MWWEVLRVSTLEPPLGDRPPEGTRFTLEEQLVFEPESLPPDSSLEASGGRAYLRTPVGTEDITDALPTRRRWVSAWEDVPSDG